MTHFAKVRQLRGSAARLWVARCAGCGATAVLWSWDTAVQVANEHVSLRRPCARWRRTLRWFAEVAR